MKLLLIAFSFVTRFNLHAQIGAKTQTRDPMIVLDGTSYVTFFQKTPW
jgi:hypothetical protein